MAGDVEYDFFVSYASVDNRGGWVDEFVKAFVAEHRAFTGGRELTYFLDRDRIPHFSQWGAEIFNKGLARSRFLLAFLSPNYLASEICRREWRAWIEQEIALHILAEGACPVYLVEVPGLLGKPPLAEREVAEKVAELCGVGGGERFAADLGPVVREVRRRQLLNLVQPFRNAGVNALQAEDVRATLRKLAEHLDTRVEEAKRANASANTVPPYNPKFTGRLDELLELRALLTHNRAGVIAGIHGLGGIGKTELAYTYAHAFAGVYPGGRFEVKCDTHTSLQTAVNISLGNAAPFRPHISDEERKRPADLFDAVKRCLKQRLDTLGPVLLVLDNVSHANLIRPPETDALTVLGPHLHLLATTRKVAMPEVRALMLGELKPADALALMEKIRPFDTPTEEAAAREIVRRLGGFALAIELVAAKLALTPSATYVGVAEGLGLDDLDVLAEQDDVTLRRHNHEKRLAAVLGPTLDSLTSEQRRAMEYGALLPPDNVPLPWLKTLVTADFPNVAKPTKWGDPWRIMVDRLIGLGLFTRVEEETTNERQVKVHRLVQELLRRKLTPEQRTALDAYILSVIQTRVTVLSSGENWNSVLWEVGPLTELAQSWADTDHPPALWLLSQVGGMWKSAGLYDRSEVAFRLSLRLAQNAPVANRRVLSRVHYELANVLILMGRYEEGTCLTNRAISFADDSTDPLLVGSLYTLRGRLLRNEAEYLLAEDWLKKAISTLKRAGGLTFYLTNAVNELGEVYRLAGHVGEAEIHYQIAIEMYEALAQHGHPLLLGAKNNLGLIRLDQSRFNEAESLFREVLAGDRRLLPATHPHIARDLNNLALALRGLQRASEAADLFEQALAIDLDNFGRYHQLVGVKYYNLGEILVKLGRFDEAIDAAQSALEIDRRCLGDFHPDVARDFSLLGTILCFTGRPREAVVPLRRAVVVALVLRRRLGRSAESDEIMFNNFIGTLHVIGHSRTEIEEEVGSAIREAELEAEDDP